MDLNSRAKKSNFAKSNRNVMQQLIDILHHEKCSCVIKNKSGIRLCHQRGVKDLLELLKNDPEVLTEASIADKVVGKGAAALRILGGVRHVYAYVMSQPALELLTASGVKTEYTTLAPNIINRAGTGVCPVESRCAPCKTASECLPLIEDFINQIQK